MRTRALLVATVMVLAAACGTVPRERSDLVTTKIAVRSDDVGAIFERYRSVRNTAVGLLDAKPLSVVESGPVLAIDTGAFEVASRLDRALPKDRSPSTVRDVLAPRFAKYPLWFVAVSSDEADRVGRVQVYQRESAVDPWLLVASPETVSDIALPGIRVRHGGAARVAAGNDVGMAESPQGAADEYAEALGDGGDGVQIDSFLRQMRRTAADNAELRDVTFSQTWKAEKVEHALRTDDGGALVFATLERTDTFKVRSGRTITWPAGSPQRAFLQQGISTSGTLRYVHQVLLQVPPKGRIRALGQFGGVVAGDGF